MNKNLLKQFSLLFLVCILALVFFTKENKIINASETTTQPVLKESQVFLLPVQEKNNIAEDQRSVDRAVDILGTVVDSIGVLVGILALILAILIGFGSLEIFKWKKIIEKIKKDASIIEKQREKIGEYLEEIRKIKTPPLSEKPTPETKEKLDRFSRKLETIEMLGVPLKPEDYLKRGADLYYKGKYELALEAYDKAIELKPDDVEAWNNRGVMLGNLKRYKLALEASNKAIELKPDYAEVWYNKACIYSLKKNKEKALKYLLKAIKLDIRYKKDAKEDEDFKDFWNDEDFKNIVK